MKIDAAGAGADKTVYFSLSPSNTGNHAKSHILDV